MLERFAIAAERSQHLRKLIVNLGRWLQAKRCFKMRHGCLEAVPVHKRDRELGVRGCGVGL